MPFIVSNAFAAYFLSTIPFPKIISGRRSFANSRHLKGRFV